MKHENVSKVSAVGNANKQAKRKDMVPRKKKRQGGFSQFFSKQRSKVRPREPVGKVLTQFAEEDLKRIAVLMQKWLQQDEEQR